ncbi:hypothetical protein SAMN00790413_01884 [Deinococcus hopiensis KR-140]|uniref:Uncharacterized protein n=1 Tax=Deinococcus hopiensis KR-140 TaxID=695939 RepID=A0A1W1VIH9_9DEIO|nr:hypothetical protein SAMN00790413_01884 [Deinococcus hopiensis KR-140]
MVYQGLDPEAIADGRDYSRSSVTLDMCAMCLNSSGRRPR